MYVQLIHTYWRIRPNALNLWCLLLLSFEIPLKPQNWNCRDSWLCNSSITVPVFPSATAGHSAKEYYYEVTDCGNTIPPKNMHLVLQQPTRSPGKTSWEPLSKGWIQNISEKIFGKKSFVKKFPGLFMDLSGLVWSHYLSISLKISILVW